MNKHNIEEIGIIEEIASGHSDDIKLLGFTIFPKTDGWVGIRKLYDDSHFWNRFKYKQLGTYITPYHKDYKIGDKVKVQIDNKKIVKVESIGHLDGIERTTHDPFILFFMISIFIILLLAILDVKIKI